MFQQDQSFRFISDPNHKENLSGRVTAACLNCRRKKIKCSGELNCSTCRERGLVCEGPPQRKRPRRDETGVSSKEAPASTQAAPEASLFRKPSPDGNTYPAGFARLDSTGTDDSGYASGKRSLDGLQSIIPPAQLSKHSGAIDLAYAGDEGSSPSDTTASTSAESASHQVSPFAFNVQQMRHGNKRAAPLMTFGPSDWSYTGRQGSSPTDARATVPERSPTSTDAHPRSANGTSIPAEWLGSRSSDDWWLSDPRNERSSKDLLIAAEVLEERARSLRNLASERRSGEYNDMMRRQPLDRGSFEISQSYQSSALPSDGSVYQQRLSSDFEGMFRPDGTLRSGLTPQANDFGSFWALNSVGQAPSQSTQQAHATPATLPQPSLPAYTHAQEPSRNQMTTSAVLEPSTSSRPTICERRMLSKLRMKT